MKEAVWIRTGLEKEVSVKKRWSQNTLNVCLLIQGPNVSIRPKLKDQFCILLY